jgi:hypothetical protein
MKSSMRLLLLGTVMVSALFLQACSLSGVPAGLGVGGRGGQEIGDIAGAVDALAGAGAEVSLGGPIDQPFVPSPGRVATVNGHDVQLFEFEDAEAAATMAGTVNATGDEIGTSIVSWIDAPHFYRSGRVVALYVGSNAATLELLEDVFGSQFAGR